MTRHALPTLLINVACALPLAAHAAGATAAAAAPGVTLETVEGPIMAKPGDVIENKRITSTHGPCVIIQQGVANVTVRHNDIGPCRESSGDYAHGIVGFDNSANITVAYNRLHDVLNGAYFYKAKHPVNFHHNRASAIYGVYPVGGSMVKLQAMSGGSAGSRIRCNVSDLQGMTSPGGEDHISHFLSIGLLNDRTEIAYNRLRGGSSKSGSAIQAGDGGGSNVWVHHNTSVNVGGGGAGIAGGQNITIENNRLFADGLSSPSGAGIYVKNYSPALPCANNIIRNNQVFTYNVGIKGIENFGTDHSCDSGLLLTGNSFSVTNSATWYQDPHIPGLNAAMFDQRYPQCTVVGTDVDGDGRSDVLLRRTSDGTVAIWRMQGANVLQKTTLPAGATWTVAGTGDFNGDGRVDLLWRRETDGLLLVSATGGASTGILADKAWSVAGTGDFNGDDKTDLLLRHADGRLALWIMDGAAVTSTAVLDADPSWAVVGVGDFNGDGKIDILRRRSSDGLVMLWTMDGSAITARDALLADTGWSVAGTGDFDGDGKTDILWRRQQDGLVMVWLMNGPRSSATAAVVMDANMSVAGTGDFDGDGKADILLRRVSDGQLLMALMDGIKLRSMTQISVDPGWLPVAMQH